jgi:trans-aconitate 2-methyltransferase
VADSWNPHQYELFKQQRSRPFEDLVAGVGRAGVRTIVDLGCGTGELTASLATTFQGSTVLGIDSSPAMLAKAAPFADGDHVRFELGDIATWEAHGEFDLVLSNAALHWVPQHSAVIARWAEALRTGGQLGVQIPYNHDHPAHTIAEELRQSAPFNAFAIESDPVADNVLTPEAYARLLFDLGLGDRRVRMEVYGHELADAGAVVEWVKGSTLTRFTKALPAEIYTEFESEYRRRVLAALGGARPCFYPFKRILFWATRL